MDDALETIDLVDMDKQEKREVIEAGEFMTAALLKARRRKGQKRSLSTACFLVDGPSVYSPFSIHSSCTCRTMHQPQSCQAPSCVIAAQPNPTWYLTEPTHFS